MEKARFKSRDEVFAKSVKSYDGKYKTVEEYSNALSTWMQNSYQLQCAAAFFPFYLASTQLQNNSQSNPTPNSQSTTTTTTRAQQPFANIPQVTQAAPRVLASREYSIPSIWKRLAAESIDFILLFMVKLALVYLATDYLNINLLQQVEEYDLETLSNYLMTDYQVAISMTSEIILFEIIHRIGICLVEALCTHRGPGGLGGSTPGKHLIGIKVVRCEWSVQMANNVNISVYPGTDLGFGRALLRSVVKNFSLTFLFPICFTLFTFQHNRTIYDIFSGSIVVEINPARPRQR